MTNTTSYAGVGFAPATNGSGGSGRTAPRMVIYSPDTYGLGHVRRCIKIVEALKALHPELSVLLLTGSPHAGRFPLPDGVDFVKLPQVVKTGANNYQARSFGISITETLELRQNLICEAVKTFRPQLMLVDHSPIGVKGELRKTLLWLKRHNPMCQIVLGMRDIIDEPQAVLATWHAESIHQVLESTYHRIFVYGAPEIFDPVTEYRFGASSRAKTSYTGFITDPPAESTNQRAVTRRKDVKEVFLTVGGGEDGMEIVDTFLRMQSLSRNGTQYLTTIVTGPFFPKQAGLDLAILAKALHVDFREFVPNIAPHLRNADLVISMGGYNTVTELLMLARKALIIPRTHPRKEQLIRAQRLSELGLVSFIRPDQLTPSSLYESVSALLESEEQPLEEARRRRTLPLDGAARLAALCSPMLNIPMAVESSWSN